MNAKPSLTKVTVQRFLEHARNRLSLELIAGERGVNRTIGEPAINRPGLALAGFYRYFPNKRIQLIGHAEFSYLMSLPSDVRSQRLESFFAAHVPCVVFSRNRKLHAGVEELAERFSIPVIRTNMVTGMFMNAAAILMEELCAPRVKVHGTMLEVAGIGVLIEGQAGIGKSETALGLIKRGHALVADDCTQLRPDSNGKLLGSAIEITRHYMEIRGLGIIHVPSVFGVAAVRGAKHVDLVVTLIRQSEVDADIDRTGEVALVRNFLGVDVPQIIIPVAPGRDLVNVVETVAQEYKLRSTGYVAFEQLDETIKRRNVNNMENN